jgi:hypothetical protein
VGQTSATARALLWSPIPISVSGVTLLGDDRLESLASSSRTRLQNQLNVTLEAGATLAQTVWALLMDPPTNGWKPLKPRRLRVPIDDGSGDLITHQWEVLLDHQVWHAVPLRAVGAQYSSAFSATENPLSEGGVWENGGGDWAVIQSTGGTARSVTLGADCAVRLISPTIGDDQFSQGVGTFAGSGDLWISPAVRMAAGTNESSYFGAVNLNTGGSQPGFSIWETTSALGYTELDENSGTVTSGHTFKMVATGTSLQLFDNGVEVSSTTDVTLTSGQPGFILYAENSTANSQWDDAVLGDGSEPETAVSIAVLAGDTDVVGHVLSLGRGILMPAEV